jgi:YjjG family noncanonical pyrimidine nucleotidase
VTYQWLLFDADGTLFDYDAAERQALRRALSAFDLGFDADVLSVYREINARMWDEFELGNVTAEKLKSERFARLFAALQLNASLDAVDFSERYLNYLGDCTDLMPEVMTVLNALQSQVGLALITNGLKAVQRSRLAKSGLDAYFEAVVISDEEGVAKPDPRIFDIAMARMDHPPKEAVLMVGDSLTSDMRGANLYGIDACWYNPDGRAPLPDVDVRYDIRSLPELLPIVDRSS